MSSQPTILKTLIEPNRRIKKVSTLLERSAEMLKSEKDVKWCKGTEFRVDPQGRKTVISACAIGYPMLLTQGLARFDEDGYEFEDFASQDSSLADQAITVLHDATAELTGQEYVYNYNDASATKKKDVLKIYERAIVKAKAAERAARKASKAASKAAR